MRSGSILRPFLSHSSDGKIYITPVNFRLFCVRGVGGGKLLGGYFQYDKGVSAGGTRFLLFHHGSRVYTDKMRQGCVKFMMFPARPCPAGCFAGRYSRPIINHFWFLGTILGSIGFIPGFSGADVSNGMPCPGLFIPNQEV